MKKFFIIVLSLLFMPLLYAYKPNYNRVFAQENSSEIVMDVYSGRVLFGKNINAKMYMASTTKILTAITVIENCDINKIVTVTDKTINVEGSSIYLKAGERLRVLDLLYGLMLRSGNDCAETLAVHCCGSIDKFCELMNKTAKNIGANNSNFVNPHGLHNDNHYTTAFDLALISRYSMKNETFRKIVSTKSITISSENNDSKRYLINKNKMLKDFPGSTGIKTGFTKKAGRCLVSSCVRDNMELICVVLNVPTMYERSKELLTNCFNDYSATKLVLSKNIIDFIQIKNSNNKCGVYIKSDIILPLRDEEKNNIEIKYIYPKLINKNVKKDTEIGCVKILYKNSLIFNEKIYNIVDTN